jgi:hypothetical protein
MLINKSKYRTHKRGNCLSLFKWEFNFIVEPIDEEQV